MPVANTSDYFYWLPLMWRHNEQYFFIFSVRINSLINDYITHLYQRENTQITDKNIK